MVKHGAKILDEGAKNQEFYEFNEGKEWIQDYYKLLWDHELDENLYAVIQYLQRKEG